MSLTLFVVDNYRRGVERLRTCSLCERYRICFGQGSRVETEKQKRLCLGERHEAERTNGALEPKKSNGSISRRSTPARLR